MPTINFKQYLPKYYHPIVHIVPQNLAGEINNLFPFAIDTSIKYNLVHSCFLEFYDDSAGISADEAEAVNDRYDEITKETGNYFHTESPRYLTHGVYETVGFKKIKCKDGIKRETQKIRLNFVVEAQAYSEIFYVDQSLCCYKKGKSQVHGILGLDFLKKHKWIIDFAVPKIYSQSEWIVECKEKTK